MADTDPPAARWVWVSTPASRAAGLPSALAITETVFCVLAFWVLVLLGWPVYWALLTTPLVLFRSDQSVQTGLTLWKALNENKQQPFWSWPALTLGFAGLIIGAALAWWAAGVIAPGAVWPWLLMTLGGGGLLACAVLIGWGFMNKSEYYLYSRWMSGALLGGGYGAALWGWYGGLAGASIGMISFNFLVLIIGVFLSAITCRVTAVLRHFPEGLRALPENWRRSVLQTDMAQPPELLPGDIAANEDRFIPSIIAEIRVSKDRYLELFLILCSVPIFYMPSYLWRWTVKSTAWLYLPLFGVSLGWINLRGAELSIWAKGYRTKAFNRIGWWFAVIGLLSSVPLLTNWDSFLELVQTLAKETAPWSVLAVPVVLDWSALWAQPWYWYLLPSWLLTLGIYIWIDNPVTDLAHGAPSKAACRNCAGSCGPAT